MYHYIQDPYSLNQQKLINYLIYLLIYLSVICFYKFVYFDFACKITTYILKARTFLYKIC